MKTALGPVRYKDVLIHRKQIGTKWILWVEVEDIYCVYKKEERYLGQIYDGALYLLKDKKNRYRIIKSYLVNVSNGRIFSDEQELNDFLLIHFL